MSVAGLEQIHGPAKNAAVAGVDLSFVTVVVVFVAAEVAIALVVVTTIVACTVAGGVVTLIVVVVVPKNLAESIDRTSSLSSRYPHVAYRGSSGVAAVVVV